MAFFSKKLTINLFLLLLTLILCITVIEIGMRVFLKKRLYVVRDSNLGYKHDDNLGWFPNKNSKKTIMGCRSFNVEHNSRGFRDAEHLVCRNRKRIVFLGDSFVWGYDVETSERFTEKLRIKLPDWLIYNLGVSGYSTVQEYLLLQQHYDFYKPDIVFLVFCTNNDEDDNSYNKGHSGNYKPYIITNEGDLEVRGTPVPKSENYFFQNHKTLSSFYWVRLLTKIYFKFTNPHRLELKDPTYEIIVHMQELVNSRGGGVLSRIAKSTFGVREISYG